MIIDHRRLRPSTKISVILWGGMFSLCQLAVTARKPDYGFDMRSRKIVELQKTSEWPMIVSLSVWHIHKELIWL